MTWWVSAPRLVWSKPYRKYRPSRLAAHMRTLIVAEKKSFTGLAVARHSGTRQYWGGGQLVKRLEEISFKLADFLEDLGLGFFSSLFSNGGFW